VWRGHGQVPSQKRGGQCEGAAFPQEVFPRSGAVEWWRRLPFMKIDVMLSAPARF
jgi:hypothetical protein